MFRLGTVQNGLEFAILQCSISIERRGGGGFTQNGGWKMFWHQIDKLISLFFLMFLNGISKLENKYMRALLCDATPA